MDKEDQKKILTKFIEITNDFALEENISYEGLIAIMECCLQGLKEALKK